MIKNQVFYMMLIAVAMITINATAISQECLFSHIETKRYSIPIPDTSAATIMVYNQAYLEQAQTDQDAQLPDGYRADFIEVETNYLNSDQFYDYVVMIYSFEICMLQGDGDITVFPDIPDPDACFDEDNIQIECDSIPEQPVVMPIDSANIPTMGTWGLYCLSLLSMICGVQSIKANQYVRE